MRRRLLDGVDSSQEPETPEVPEVPSTVANLCDVVFYDTSTGKIDCVPNADIGNVASTYKPIGIVVIPQSHDVYGDGSCCVMALKPISCSTPTSGYCGTGDTSYAYVEFGGTRGAYTIPIEPINNTLTISAMTQTNTSRILTYFTPPPYIMNGMIPTENKYDAFFVGDHLFNKFGPSTHNKFIEMADTMADWRNVTDSKFIANLGEAAFYAGPVCAARYMTPYDTTIENWYYPDNGEIIYIWSQMGKIMTTMNSLNATYGSVFVVPGIHWQTFTPFAYRNSIGCYLWINGSMTTDRTSTTLGNKYVMFLGTSKPTGRPVQTYSSATSMVGPSYAVRKMKFEEKTS